MIGFEWAEPWYRLLALLAIPAWWLAMDLPAAESAVRLTLQLVV